MRRTHLWRIVALWRPPWRLIIRLVHQNISKNKQISRKTTQQFQIHTWKTATLNQEIWLLGEVWSNQTLQKRVLIVHLIPWRQKKNRTFQSETLGWCRKVSCCPRFLDVFINVYILDLFPVGVKTVDCVFLVIWKQQQANASWLVECFAYNWQRCVS